MTTDRQAELARRREYEADHSDPHLFLAKNAQGADVLWWGEGPDDRRCQELDLSSLRRGNRDAEKAVWEAVMGSYLVEDCTDWTSEDSEVLR